ETAARARPRLHDRQGRRASGAPTRGRRRRGSGADRRPARTGVGRLRAAAPDRFSVEEQSGAAGYEVRDRAAGGHRQVIPLMKPCRTIEGISAVLLPFTPHDTIDWETFRALLDRTWAAGLTPAVNMDTGYVHLLTSAERARVLAETEGVARGRRFVAGAFIEGADDGAANPEASYTREVEVIRKRGGTPILFQCSALARASDAQVVDIYARVGATSGPLPA